MTLIELKSELGPVWLNPDSVDAIDFQLEGRCYVRCGGVDYLTMPEYGKALLEIINGKVAAAAPVNTQVRAIVSIECRETYSSTAKQHFKFFTCIMENGEKVNIFNHPDDARNTFKIADKKGWGHLLSLNVGDTREYFPEIAVTVSHDGEWYSLVDIINHMLWTDLNWRRTDSEPQEELPLDIEYDSDTSAAIDNLKTGLDLDDPVEWDLDDPDDGDEEEGVWMFAEEHYVPDDYGYDDETDNAAADDDDDDDDDNPVFYIDGDELPAAPVNDRYEQWGEWGDYNTEYWEGSHFDLNPFKGVPRCPKCGAAPLDQRRRDAIDMPVTETAFRCVLNHTWQTSDTHD